MDLLVSSALEALREAGLEEASLANAPLANVSELKSGLEKGVTLLFEWFEQLQREAGKYEYHR